MFIVVDFETCTPKGIPPVPIVRQNRIDCFVAHNANYERNILDRLEIEEMTCIPYIDTMLLGKRILPEMKRYTLDRLAEYFEISIPRGRHRAVVDCYLTLQVLEAEKNKVLRGGQDWQKVRESCSIRSKFYNQQLSIF